MKSVPSRMLVRADGSPAEQRHLLGMFESNGIDVSKLILGGRTTAAGYVDRIHSIDVALDTFPYNGMTTTCELLWRGVPVVTLAGLTHVSRVGLGILTTVGLEECIACTGHEYVDKAVALARDHAKRAELRRSIRRRMRDSSLMSGARLAREMEAAFRIMWRRWSESYNSR